MSQYNDPGKLEAAFAAVVDALTLDIYSGDSPATEVFIRTGMDDDDFQLPNVTCMVVESGDEVVRGTGNWQSTVMVRVCSSANVSLAEHRARHGAVFDSVLQDDIKTTLSAAVDDFTVLHVMPRGPVATRKEPVDNGFMWVSELTLEVIWAGSDIS
jgi:hypothetical protein